MTDTQRPSAFDANELKAGGFIMQRQANLFTVRLRCPGGKVTAQQLRKAADLSEKYGRGEIHNSVRQSIEIPYVHLDNLPVVAAELAGSSWALASCGPRVRVPTACAGCTWNPNGLMDTQKMCQEVDKHFFGETTAHHKFKISFSGCPIDCARTREMDLGFQGIAEPECKTELCTACGLCASACEEKAITMQDGLPVRDRSKCNYCGDCVKVCPAESMVEKRAGWLIRAGGKHGKHPLYGYEVAQFATDDKILSVIEKTVPWYKANAKGRERIGATIGRLGVAKYVNEVVKSLGIEAIDDPADRRKFWAAGNFYA
jgi:anaerobic sulfite reductase subunit C